MPTATLMEFQTFAEKLALRAGQLALEKFGRARHHLKHDQSVVTEVDQEIEAFIRSAVAQAYPHHAMIGEEIRSPTDALCEPGKAQYTWVVDPLDGTRNYVAGFPCFSTSIGLFDGGQPVVAVIREHNIGNTYTAIKGEGAWLGDTRLQVRDRPDGKDWLVGAPSTKDKLTIGVLTRWLATPGLVYRNVGSTAMQLSLVASGALSATFAKRCKIWDVAAGALLVLEAGGCFTDPRGGDLIPFDVTLPPENDLPFLAAAPEAHQYLLDSIADLTASSS